MACRSAAESTEPHAAAFIVEWKSKTPELQFNAGISTTENVYIVSCTGLGEYDTDCERDVRSMCAANGLRLIRVSTNRTPGGEHAHLFHVLRRTARWPYLLLILVLWMGVALFIIKPFM